LGPPCKRGGKGVPPKRFFGGGFRKKKKNPSHSPLGLVFWGIGPALKGGKGGGAGGILVSPPPPRGPPPPLLPGGGKPKGGRRGGRNSLVRNQAKTGRGGKGGSFFCLPPTPPPHIRTFAPRNTAPFPTLRKRFFFAAVKKKNEGTQLFLVRLKQNKTGGENRGPGGDFYHFPIPGSGVPH